MLNVGNVDNFIPTLVGEGKYVGKIIRAEGKTSERTGRFYAKLKFKIVSAEKGTMVTAVETGKVKEKSGEPIVEWEEAVNPKTGKVIEAVGEAIDLPLYYPMDGDSPKYADKQMALLKGLLKAIVGQLELADDEDVETEEFVKRLEDLVVGIKVSKPKIYQQNEDGEWFLTDYPGNDLYGFFKAN